MTTNIDNKTIPTNTALIDSLSLKIELSKVKVIDKRLTSQTCVYYASLDAVDCELNPPKPIAITKNGITVRFSIAEIPKRDPLTGETTQVRYVVLTVSTKLLKSKYFEGISKYNIGLLHQEFMRFKIFECSLETFLSGMVSDIDICTNRYTPSPSIFSDIIDRLVLQANKHNKYIRKFGDNINLGVSFNKRNDAKPSLPFIKLYHKELELRNHSKEFFETFLKKDFNTSLNGLTRTEVTIRNYKHKQRLKKFGVIDDFRTLGELLEIPRAQLYNVITFSIGAYVNVKKLRTKAPKLPPMEHLIYELMANNVQEGRDFQQIIAIADTFIGSSKGATEVAKTRMRQKITELYDLMTFKDEKLKLTAERSEVVNDYLRALGINKN